jgi:hypothetical protein
MNQTTLDTPRKFLFLLASARGDGNTETLARCAAGRLPDRVERRWLRLSDTPLPEFCDIRHVTDRVFPEPVGNERLLRDATFDATDLVVASPLYWYSVSASAKLYLDYWSKWMSASAGEFRARMRGKTLWGVTVLSEADPQQADPLVGMLRRSAEYLDMRWGGVLVGFGNRPDDVLGDTSALARARTFFDARGSRQSQPAPSL